MSKLHASLGRGYSVIQRTKPQTLGYSLADSPVGLLAWIYEKLVTWSDSYPWEDDEGQSIACIVLFNTLIIRAEPNTVLTWISLYLFSAAGPAASVRIYYETVNARNSIEKGKLWSYVQLGLSYFPRELCVVPKMYAISINVIRPVGGVLNVIQMGTHAGQRRVRIGAREGWAFRGT